MVRMERGKMTYWEAIAELVAECENLDIDEHSRAEPCERCHWCRIRQAIINEVEGLRDVIKGTSFS